jgi:hypothetical protein
VTLLPAKPLNLGNCHALDADFRQRIAYIVEFEWLNDCCDEFHGTLLIGRLGWITEKGTGRRALIGLADDAGIIADID